MTIRDATREDLSRIVEIYNAAIPGRLATADTEPITAASRAGWFGDHDAGRHPLWVAVEGTREDLRVDAWLSFSAFYGRPAYHATAELSVYVAPEAQRRGHARRLLERALQRAPGLGISALLGFIFGHNEPSLALFEGFGFRRWGTLPRVAELDGIERDLVIVGLRLKA